MDEVTQIKPANPILEYCEREKIGPAELGKRAGVSRQLARSWMSGKFCPGSRHINKVSRLLGMDVETMVEQIHLSKP